MTSIGNSLIEVAASSLGAELQSISLGGIEYLWQGDPAFWPRRSPLLFPIVGGLPGGTYAHRGRTYKLPNHGFARDREFRLASNGPESMRFELASDEDSLGSYPFHFRLAVTYSVRNELLEVAYEVLNSGDERMHFSIGAHPAFRAPMTNDERREDFDLIFEQPESVGRHFVTAENLLSGETEAFLRGADSLPVAPTLFERGAIVLKDHVSRKVTMRSRVSGRFVELSFPGFPQLGIWSPKAVGGTVAPFVCIEPWFGVMPRAGSTQDLERKEAVLRLGPHSRFRAAYSIRVG